MNTQRARAQTLRCQLAGGRGVLKGPAPPSPWAALSHLLAVAREVPYALPGRVTARTAMIAVGHVDEGIAMEFGTFLLLQTPSAEPSDVIYRRGVEITQAAEELGFKNMWLAEHHFSTYGL